MKKKISIKDPDNKNSSNMVAEDWVKHRTQNKRLTIDIPGDLHSKLKIESVKIGQTMGDIVRSCIEEYLAAKSI